jgi:hypothetical protein
MKRIILIVALTISVIPVFSQISVGITGGGTLTRFHYGYSDDMTNKFITAWHAGLVAETKLTGHVYLQPQLLVSRQGGDSRFERHVGSEIFYNRILAHTTYLQLPVNVIYKYKRWYGGVGPYVARGLGGKFRLESKYAKIDQLTAVRSESYETGKVKLKDNLKEQPGYGLTMQAMD